MNESDVTMEEPLGLVEQEMPSSKRCRVMTVLENDQEWDRYLCEHLEALGVHDVVNHRRCRILILSGTEAQETSEG